MPLLRNDAYTMKIHIYVIGVRRRGIISPLRYSIYRDDAKTTKLWQLKH